MDQIYVAASVQIQNSYSERSMSDMTELAKGFRVPKYNALPKLLVSLLMYQVHESVCCHFFVHWTPPPILYRSSDGGSISPRCSCAFKEKRHAGSRSCALRRAGNFAIGPPARIFAEHNRQSSSHVHLQVIFNHSPRRRHEVLRNIVQDALESVEHAHQAIGVMRVVSYSLRGSSLVWTEKGRGIFLGVAFLALPAIDSNDPKMTIAASGLFLTIFSWVDDFEAAGMDTELISSFIDQALRYCANVELAELDSGKPGTSWIASFASKLSSFALPSCSQSFTVRQESRQYSAHRQCDARTV